MQAKDLDAKISSFLDRKSAEFPSLALAGRHESRTVKYAQTLRAHGQVMLPR